MKDPQIKNFLAKLSETFFLFAPQKESGGSKIQEVKNTEAIDWSGEVPQNTWKGAFFPAQETLFEVRKGDLVEAEHEYPPVAGVGINVLDLKALTLLDQVFSRDCYYQKRRRNLLLIGYSAFWPQDYKKYKVFSHNFEEDILEHLVFDVFLAKAQNGKIKIYSGSEKGQRILEKHGLKNYQHVEFAGVVAEKGPDKKMLAIKAKLEKSFNNKVWNELDKICLACGKCAITCPTCFCFDLADRVDPANQSRVRRWGNCFYNDFSLVAGGGKELDTVKQKIYFWYVHKFVRIPHEYGLPGCVSCGRCAKACPVGIRISEVLKKIGGI